MGLLALLHLAVQVCFQITHFINVGSGLHLKLQLPLLSLVQFDLRHFPAEELSVEIVLRLLVNRVANCLDWRIDLGLFTQVGSSLALDICGSHAKVYFDLFIVLSGGLVPPALDCLFNVEATLLARCMKCGIEIWSDHAEDKFACCVILHDDLCCVHLGWRITTSSPTSLGGVDLEESSSCVLGGFHWRQVDLVLSFEHLFGDAR